jgi:tripartite-type tricarboxylate transporter receptor subunit TctC
MKIQQLAIFMYSLSLTVAATSMASAQEFPSRPLRIVTNLAGGSSDFASRLIGQGLNSSLGQPVIVDNRPSAVIAAELVAKAPPDGHTMLMFGSSLWIGTLLAKLSYDPIKDFAPITIVSTEPSILVVHPSVPAKSVKELIALAKAKPGELNYGTGGNGSAPHIAGAQFNSMAGINIVRVPYKNAAAAATGMLGGEGNTIHVGFWGLHLVSPYLKSGKMRALAVTSAQPFSLAPTLPTVAASGLPGYSFASFDGIFAPAKTPEAIVNRLNQEIVRTLKQQDVKEKFLTLDLETVGCTPREFAVALKADMDLTSKIIREAGIRAE